MADVYLNGALIGEVDSPQEFITGLKTARREGRLSNSLNAAFRSKQNSVYLSIEKNRVRRPLVVIKDGKSMLTSELIQKLKSGDLKWSDLVKQGIIEYIDASEEEDTFIAMREADITQKHTHLEIDPIAIYGVSTAMVPFANYNQVSKLYRGQKGQKQALGCYAANFLLRTDTSINLLHYPQKPIAKSFMQDVFGEDLSAGQNVVVAVINYEGYNIADALVINRASLERGFGRSTYYRPYVIEKLRYPGGQVDEIIIPPKDVQGYTLEHDYALLNEDGIIYPEAEVAGGDALVGRTSPPRFLGKLEAFSTAANVRKDTSVRVRYSEKGVVSKVLVTENEDGDTLIKVEVRDSRSPEIGDKFSSRYGQKGVIGHVVDPEDMPFSASGIVPDILFSPNGLPKRMTVGHMIEMLAGKVGGLAGRTIDGSLFQSESVGDIRTQLEELGFSEDGTEIMYDGKTGKQYSARIFVGNIYYMRLKYQVADKMQSRTRGPVALLTRQPTEGKAKEGGLRLGEMEKDCLVAHGAALLLKERFDSDREVVWICEKCGNIAIYDSYKNKAYCLCGEKTNLAPIEMSYAFKLFIDELKSMHLRPKLILKDKY
ncbi:MAG TPA: DNA-directed RNA polymerase subunit B [Nanoarchaeota archaeon]|nr:DNA-directed RNA polymerase subunit B [Nanoarchaeota archaeon]